MNDDDEDWTDTQPSGGSLAAHIEEWCKLKNKRARNLITNNRTRRRVSSFLVA